MFHKLQIVFLSSFLFINCSLSCDIILAASLNFLFFHLLLQLSSHTEKWPEVFIYCERPVIFLSFFAIFLHNLCVMSFFLSIFYLFPLYANSKNYYSLLHKLLLKFPFFFACFVPISPLNSFVFVCC